MDANVITVKQKLTEAEQLAIKEQLENVGLRLNLIYKGGEVEWIGRPVQIRFSKKDDEHTVWVRYTGDTQRLETIPEAQMVGWQFGRPPNKAEDKKPWALSNQLKTKHKTKTPTAVTE